MIEIVNDYKNEYLKKYGIYPANGRVIRYNNIMVGVIDYVVYHNRIKIDYITIENEFRRNGIASKVIKQIQNENPGKFIYGDSLPSAINFWKSLGAKFEDVNDEDDYTSPFIIQ